MRKATVITGILGFVLLWPVFSWSQVGEDYTIELEGRYWKPKLDSTVKIVDSGIGSEVKLVDDLGFEEKKDFGEGRLQIKFARKHKINFSYLPLKWDADKVLTKTIEFSGKLYTVGTRVESELDLKLFKAGYEYDFIAGKYGFLGGTIDVMVADVFVQIKAPDTGTDEKEDTTVPFPMIGLIGRVYPIRWVNLTAKVSGLPLGSYGHIFDAEASLTINPIKYVGITGGYRYMDAKGERDDNSMDLKLQGPFLALAIRF